MRIARAAAALASSLVVGVALAAPAEAATAAYWGMGEGAGARTMTGAPGPNGSIGADVRTGVSTAGVTGYRFPGGSGVDAGRLVRVADQAALDPGTGRFVVSVRFHTGSATANIVQKGQANTPGGFFKVERTRGRAVCTFRDGAGRTAAAGRASAASTWTTVRCERTASSVRITVDGASSSVARSTGSIANDQPLSIGGKTSCNGTSVGCDYFAGAMDWVRVER